MELCDCPHSHRQNDCRQHGQSLVEFALVLPIMFTVIFGIIELCLLYESTDSVNFAAREGARVGAALGPTDVAADSKIIQAIQVATSGESNLLFSQFKY